MDLDKIKEVWQENTLLKEKLSLTDNKIREILQREGQTAIAKLIRYAKFYVYATIPLALLFCVCSHSFFRAGWPYVLVPLFFCILCVCVAFPFEIYLYRLLKAIDFSAMSLKEVSTKILKYQKIIRVGEVWGIIFFLVYMCVWMFFFYRLTFGEEIIWGFIIYMIVLLVLGLIAIPLLYKKLYYKNINKIKESINELEEFEREE